MNLDKEWYRSEFIHHEYADKHRMLEAELSFYEAVVEGDMEIVEESCRRNDFANPDGMGVLSENPLRNLRYHFVVTAAMITRYCVHGGMEQDKAYSLSDFYILKMDQCKSEQEIAKLHDVMCKDYCRQMNAIRKSSILSKPVVLCLDYIYSHLHDRITLETLADYLGLSKNYLSALFKKEMGIPISTYINNLKIEKACNLLQFSEYSLRDVAAYFSFSSESHFIQVFQKRMGMTPDKFRKNNFRKNWNRMDTYS